MICGGDKIRAHVGVQNSAFRSAYFLSNAIVSMVLLVEKD